MNKLKSELISLTIGITAYNEEKNIVNLLRSVLRQKQKGFIIKKIIVISDGSTDQTVDKIRQVHSKRVTIFDDKQRLGKALRLNQIFKSTTSDAVVIFDADVVLLNENVLNYLISPLIRNLNKKFGFISGRAKPRKGRTFIENCVNASYEAYDNFRTKIKSGNNPYSAEGRIMLITKSFIRHIKIPSNMTADDNYLYFLCLKHGLEFKYIPQAVVYYRSPSSLKDHILQNIRFVSRDRNLESIFGKIVSKEYNVSRITKYFEFFKVFLKKPIYSASILIINLYCKYQSKKMRHKIGSLWTTASSTKSKINFHI